MCLFALILGESSFNLGPKCFNEIHIFSYFLFSVIGSSRTFDSREQLSQFVSVIPLSAICDYPNTNLSVSMLPELVSGMRNNTAVLKKTSPDLREISRIDLDRRADRKTCGREYKKIHWASKLCGDAG